MISQIRETLIILEHLHVLVFRKRARESLDCSMKILSLQYQRNTFIFCESRKDQG